MFLTLWEFEVKSGCEELFEQAYGPAGDWVRLFRRDARYGGTWLLRDVARERVYVTIDMWESQQAYEEFREKCVAGYEHIDKDCCGLTLREKYLGERTPK